MTPLTPEEARDQLATADTLATTSGSDARIGAFTTAAVGVLVAAATVWTRLFTGTNTAAYVIGMLVYATAIITLMRWHGRRFRVADRGWSRRYLASLGLTMALHAIGIGWATSGSPSWTVFAPLCVLIALPMVVMASLMARR
jgi:peptidoglycan/LPS O-acetylase OafA/YrhL